MALTVLGIGMLGIVGLQKTTVVSNQEAQQLTVANVIARTWVERLQRDAGRWTAPNATTPTSNITNTAWLGSVGGTTSSWMRPASSALERTAMPAFDLNGIDVDPASPNVMYCTNLRLRYIYPDKLIRAEVRVFWVKRSLANPSAVPWLLTSGVCSQTSGLDAIGSDDKNFHWVYAVAAIPKAVSR
ncbi:MAG: hypothetical protein NVSMB1_07500 [Polyangiales bacterium]